MARILIVGAAASAAKDVYDALLASRHDLLFLGSGGEGEWIQLPRVGTGYVERLLQVCVARGIDCVIPVLDDSLLCLAYRRDEFRAVGVELLLAPTSALENCLDRVRLFERCRDIVRCPDTAVAGEGLPVGMGPWIARPRRVGSAEPSRWVEPYALGSIPRDGSWVLQEAIVGTAVDVDVLLGPKGVGLAAVPRCDGAVHGDLELELKALAVARTLGVRGVATVQFIRDLDGPVLIGIRPRFSTGLELTRRAGVDLASLSMELFDGEPVLPPAWREVDPSRGCAI